LEAQHCLQEKKCEVDINLLDVLRDAGPGIDPLPPLVLGPNTIGASSRWYLLAPVFHTAELCLCQRTFPTPCARGT
jgi:hypothetical protein